MGIKHKFISPVADDGIPAGEVKPSNWNDEHDADGLIGALLPLDSAASVIPYLDAAGVGQLSPLTALGRLLLGGIDLVAIRAALGLAIGADVAAVDSPALGGMPTAPTAPLGTNTNQIATMAALQAAIAALVGGAPSALDTLKELADAINDDDSYAATVTAALANRLRVDAAQGLSPAQQAIAVANLALATVAVSGAYADLTGKPVIGTAANNLVQLDGSAKLPAVDGSQLTNVSAGGALLFSAVQSLTAAQTGVAQANIGLPFNGTVVESHSGNAVTFAVKTLAGNDPDVSNPVVFRFPTGSGGYTWVNVTAALSITVPAGATLGQRAGDGFRVWIAAFNDAGTVRLAVRCCASLSVSGSVTSPVIVASNESSGASSTLTPANAAHVFYTTGAAVVSKPWMWIATATYESGLATAGAWAVAPDAVALVDRATPRPGAIVQQVVLAPAVNGSFTDTVTHALSGGSLALNSPAHFVAIECDGYVYLRTGASNQGGYLSIYRGSTAIQGAESRTFSAATSDMMGSVHLSAFDKPNGAGASYNAVARGNLAASIQYATWNFTLREIAV